MGTVLKWGAAFIGATIFTGLSVIALNAFDDKVVKIPGWRHGG